MGVYLRLVKSNKPVPKKRFGQHFLRDTGVLERIIRWIQPEPGDLFLEIGAGDGALSALLAPKAGHLLAIEVDLDCIPLLEKALVPSGSSTIITGDILKLDLRKLVTPRLEQGFKLRIAGNLPYNIATAIIEKLLHSGLPIQDMFFMVQLEVAQRIAANPGSRQYGYLSVYCRHHSYIQMGFKVSPACFVPRPKVSSAMIFFRPKPDLQDPVFESSFEALVKAAFSHRRKTLENSLRKNSQFGEIADRLLNKAGIDGSRRAEQLSVQEYEHLAQVFQSFFQAR